MTKNAIISIVSGIVGSVFTMLILSLLFPMNGIGMLARSQSNQYILPALNSNSVPITVPAANTSIGALLQERANELLPDEKNTILIYEKRNKSVVNIDTVQTRLRNFFFEEEAEGRGSGIVLNNQGIILTNFHVVDGADVVSVTLFNGETYQAQKVGVDPNTDIAILKIEAPAESLVPIDFGDSSKLLVGQKVYAIGNPFGHDRTLTQGIISNLNRTIASPQQFRQIKGVIQIDAAINPGNSGGPLLDSQGRMIGMNTAIASRIGENSGVGFAIPVNTIQRIASILLQEGKVVRGDIGVVQVTETDEGLLPVLINGGGAADRAGLRGRKMVILVSRQGGIQMQQTKIVPPDGGMDIIVGVNGQQIRTGEEFITLVEDHRSGETIKLNIIRQGEPMELPIVLD
ncbi:MAG: trypsin-like peptidase domain-containing protein [Planctomycetia bacterium]|nr:trypsin-like peptidase domain-containing protein [Planctomycetia bacterium]